MALTLERQKGTSPSKAPGDLSANGAETISRIWQAVAFIEEVREGLPGNGRRRQAHSNATKSLRSAVQKLMNAAESLMPSAAAE